METTSQNEEGAGRIAAALSASLKALSEVQEAQKRIEDRQKKAREDLARHDKRMFEIEKDLERGFGTVAGRIDSVMKEAEALGKAFEKSRKEKKPIRWKHHLRALLIVLAALAIGHLAGYVGVLKTQAMENEKLELDNEREIGHAVRLKVMAADAEQRELITLLISGEEMDKEKRLKLRKWLEDKAEMADLVRHGK